MMSFGRQFDFHDIIYHIHVQPCNVDNRRCNVIFKLMDVQSLCKNTGFSPNTSNMIF